METKKLNKLIKAAAKNSYYMDGRLSVGIYARNNLATLIDSGIDVATAKKINSALKSSGFSVGEIINTHSHADHCGGNAFFQKEYPGIKIYSTNYEKSFIENPKMEPMCFCGTAEPFAELRNKHLEASPSIVTNVISPYVDQSIETETGRFNIITLPGHTPGMIGVVTEDNVLYCGDAIFGDETFRKHGILFYTNISDTLKSFEKLAGLKVDELVFYHGGLAQDNIANIAEKHKQRILETKDSILSIINEGPVSIDELTGKVLNFYQIKKDIVQFTLTRVCINSYVSQLQNENAVTLNVDSGNLLAISNSSKKLVSINEFSDDNKNLIKYTFSCYNSNANFVHLAGTFNDWLNATRGLIERNEKNDLYLMDRQNDNQWTYTIKLPKGRYEFKYVVDGGRYWRKDPDTKYSVSVTEHGINSVLHLDEETPKITFTPQFI